MDDKRAAEVLSQLRGLLKELSVNPGEAPKSYAGLARAISVDPATLWRHRKSDNRVQQTADTIIRAAKAGHSRLPRGDSKRAKSTTLTQAESKPTRGRKALTREFEDCMDATRWPFRKFLREASRHQDLSDLPRLTFELQQFLLSAEQNLEALKQLNDQWLRSQVS